MKAVKILSFALAAVVLSAGITSLPTARGMASAENTALENKATATNAETYENAGYSVPNQKLYNPETNIKDEAVYARPQTTPQGKKYKTDYSMDFTAGSYQHIENDDFEYDTIATEYGIEEISQNNPAFYMCLAGAGINASFEAWPNVKKNIVGAAGNLMYVDFSGLRDKRDVNIGITMKVSPSPEINWSTWGDEVSTVKSKKGTDCYYYDFVNGDWQASRADKNGMFELPDGYKGYIFTPMDGYNYGDNVWLHVYHVEMRIGENFESTSQIVLDDISLVSHTTVHTHEFVAGETFAPDCEHMGMTLNTCECGTVKWTDVREKTAHSLGEAHCCGENLAGAICSECGRLVYSEAEATPWEEGVTVTFASNLDGVETVKRTYPKGYVLTNADIPWQEQYTNDGLTYAFHRYTSDKLGVEGYNPVGLKLKEDFTIYGNYNICSYDFEKLKAMYSDVSFNGGPYYTEAKRGGVIFIGHSNFSLWHSMEWWYEQHGIPGIMNNSCAGGTSYNFSDYLEELVLMYKPKIVVTGLSSNDYCYHQMTDRAIFNEMVSFYERIQEVCPETKVIILSDNPLAGRPEYFTAIKRTNAKVEEWCSKQKNAIFVDTYDMIMEHTLKYPEGWEFWTHMNQDVLEDMLGEAVFPIIRLYY